MRKTIRFHDLDQTLDYVVLGFNVPTRGEYYLSGHENTAYLARCSFNDGVKRMIVAPVQPNTPPNNVVDFVKHYGSKNHANSENLH